VFCGGPRSHRVRCRATCHGRVLRRAGGSGRRPPRGTAAGEGAGTEAQAPSVADPPIAPRIEGEALHLPQEGARAILRLLGGARVSLHHKIVTEEREVRVSLALQSPHLKVPTLGWQKIRMLLISKG